MTDASSEQVTIDGTPDDDTPGASRNPGLATQLLAECLAMVRHALSNGLEVSPQGLKQLNAISAANPALINNEQVQELGRIHHELARSVAPATPRAIVQLSNSAGSRLHFLGPVPLVRQLSLVSILFLLGLLGVSLSGSVNLPNLNAGLFNSQGPVLAINQLFLLCAVGLGASFSALFKLNSYVSNVTYDPRYDSSYWTHIILGIIAGVILLELLPDSLFKGSDFGKPALAMFGGFSAGVVHRILLRLVETLETMVKGSGDRASAAAQSLRTQASEQRSRVNSEIAAQLVELNKELEQSDGKGATEKLNQIIKKLLGDHRE